MSSRVAGVVAGSASLVARTIAAALLPGRFRGKAALLQLGTEEAIGACEATPREREIKALRGEYSGRVELALALEVVEAARAKRLARFDARKKDVDALASRQPGNVVERATMRAFRRALLEFAPRTTTHGATTRLEYVAPGAEGVSSTTESVRPSDVGLSAAYARKAFFITTSTHVWRVSRSFFAVPAAERVRGGKLNLSPTKRVRQGRGTSLVCEAVAP